MSSISNSLYRQARSQLMQPATLFMISSMLVNGGNYLYNLVIGRTLGPAAFAEAGILMSLILIVSFMGMTFQMVATKFSVELGDSHQAAFRQLLRKTSWIAGIGLAVLLLLTAKKVALFLNLQSAIPLYIFALCLPAYFGMSYQRGLLQGKQLFTQLAGSYQVELWSKVALTAILLICFPHLSGVVISVAMTLSVITGMLHTNTTSVAPLVSGRLSTSQLKQISRYAGFIVLYEGIQILINYGDLFMVNHYFDQQTAGMYTSLSVIGRMVYFLTWMLVMVLIPSVLQNRQSGKPYHHLMHRYLGMISGAVAALVTLCHLLPELLINSLFGASYLPLATHLWLYALATGLFAIANLFLYYFIAIEKFSPVYVAGAIAVLQLIAYQLHHHTIANMIEVQVAGMLCLLVILAIWYVCTTDRNRS